MENEDLKNQIDNLKNEISTLRELFKQHLHTGLDETKILNKTINLELDQYLKVGLGMQGTAPIDNSKLGTTGEQIQYSIGVGSEDGKSGFTNKVKNMQMNFLYQPKSSLKLSFLNMFRDGCSGSISVTSGGNTATINGIPLETNEYQGAIINIFNSSGALVESQIVASNTSNQITISSTWGASTTGFFIMFFPVYLGSSDTIYQRGYFQEGTSGGIRFGIGPTWTSGTAKNGLLYMDASGDLYWRNKSGTATKLN